MTMRYERERQRWGCRTEDVAFDPSLLNDQNRSLELTMTEQSLQGTATDFHFAPDLDRPGFGILTFELVCPELPIPHHFQE